MSICIIAEAGSNHNGSIEKAKKLIDEAAKAGADYIKFQRFEPEKLASKNAKKANYQSKNVKDGDTQLSLLKKLRLSREDFVELKDYCNEKEIGFLATPYDLESVEFIKSLNLDFWKIPSGEVTDYPFLKKIAGYEQQIVMSTGMCTDGEVGEAIDVLNRNGGRDIILLHCNTQYPTPVCDVNLKAMVSMRKQFCLPTGFSDHTNRVDIPISAAALGAAVIEKHITLDRNEDTIDNSASLEPEEFKRMVEGIRATERALGIGAKSPSAAEREYIAFERKSIVASKPIKKGEVFTEENLTCKRPGTGLSPMKWDKVIGMKAMKDYKEDDFISE